jgi:Ca2+-binding RTX toxin-like protein
VAALSLVTGAAGTAAGGDGNGAPGSAHRQATAGVAEYWTAARMRAARPLDMRLAAPPPAVATAAPRDPPAFVPPAAPGQAGAALRSGDRAGASAFSPGAEKSFPNRLHGKVFATYPALGDYACSATAVNSPGRSLVVSAGHCIFDPQTGDWATNWTFVPGYRSGRAPFGRWVARSLDAADPWVKAENISFDVGTAVVARNRSGRALQDVVGGRGIGFGLARDRVYTSYGYPAELPFDGESLRACRSPYRGDDPDTDPPRTMRISCDMTGGSSGGGWVSSGMVLSLNSYCTGLVLVCLDNTSMYGPYFGDGAKELYLRSRGNPPPLCAGRRATQLGGAGTQRLSGRGRADTIRLGPGDDTGLGRRGPDRLCGGAGDDRLRGGPGFDVCVGGPGADTASACERRRGIP